VEFFKSLSYLSEVVRTNFFTDFWSFRNFRPQFRENYGATWRRKWELCSDKERSLVRRKAETALKTTHKPRRNTCSSYAPLECTPLRTRSVTNKNRNIQTPHFLHLVTAGAHSTIFPKLCMVIENVETIKMVQSFFDPMHSISYRVVGKILGTD